MRAILQRVEKAAVHVDGRTVGEIGVGLLGLVAAAAEDSSEDVEWLASKILSLKLFETPEGTWQTDLAGAGGGLLLVSQFTLLASTRKGTRPSWHRAAPPEPARALFDALRVRCETQLGRPVATGVFGAQMRVELVNNGPVTLLLDSKLRE